MESLVSNQIQFLKKELMIKKINLINIIYKRILSEFDEPLTVWKDDVVCVEFNDHCQFNPQIVLESDDVLLKIHFEITHNNLFENIVCINKHKNTMLQLNESDELFYFDLIDELQNNNII